MSNLLIVYMGFDKEFADDTGAFWGSNGKKDRNSLQRRRMDRYCIGCALLCMGREWRVDGSCLEAQGMGTDRLGSRKSDRHTPCNKGVGPTSRPHSSPGDRWLTVSWQSPSRPTKVQRRVPFRTADGCSGPIKRLDRLWLNDRGSRCTALDEEVGNNARRMKISQIHHRCIRPTENPFLSRASSSLSRASGLLLCLIWLRHLCHLFRQASPSETEVLE